MSYLPPEARRAYKLVAALQPTEAIVESRPTTPRVLRAEQLPPSGDWALWLILAGRGFGKTLTGANWLAEKIRATPNGRFAVVASTIADARDTMIEGVTGLLSVLEPHELKDGNIDAAWNRSLGELFLANGGKVKTFSSEKPRGLRGPQHHNVWGDEPAEWHDSHKGAMKDTTFSNLEMGCRLGDNPQICLTGTPKPTRLIREILARVDIALTRGSTYSNKANLSTAYLNVIKKYEGTRLGQQELDGELLEDVQGALWSFKMFEADGFRLETAPHCKRVVVGVDPNASNTENSDEMGIIVTGLTAFDTFVVLADYTIRGTPLARASAVVNAYHDWQADAVVIEVNNGGDWIPSSINNVDKTVNCKTVHATRGKLTRAEPIAAKYEKGLVQHLGVFAELEDELTQWTVGEKSPNRLDALVWGITDLDVPEQELFFGRA